MKMFLAIFVVFLLSSFAQAETLEEALFRTSMDINKKTPMMIDKEGRLDSTMAFGKSLSYYYTLINYSVDDLSSVEISNFSKSHRAMLINSYCTLPGQKLFRDNKVTLKYIYRGKFGKHVTSIDITYRNCK